MNLRITLVGFCLCFGVHAAIAEDVTAVSREMELQEQISKRIVKLLGLTLGAHHDAPLVPDAPTAKKRKAAVPARIA